MVDGLAGGVLSGQGCKRGPAPRSCAVSYPRSPWHLGWMGSHVLWLRKVGLSRLKGAWAVRPGERDGGWRPCVTASFPPLIPSEVTTGI